MELPLGADLTFWILLGSSVICIVLSFVMMNEARDRVHKGLGKTNSNTRLATANMFLYIIVVFFCGYAFFQYFLCEREVKASTASVTAKPASGTS